MIDTATMLLVGAGLLIAALAIMGIMAVIRQRNAGKEPGVDAILDALQPWIYKAILAGEKLALDAMTDADTRINALDKKAVADSVYNALPETLSIAGVVLPITTVKRFVTQEMFEQWVKQFYESADAFIERNKSYLQSQVDALKPVKPAPQADLLKAFERAQVNAS